MSDARDAIVHKSACKMLQLPADTRRFFELEDGKDILDTLGHVYDAGYLAAQACDVERRKAARNSHPIIFAVKRVVFILVWMTFWPIIVVGIFSQVVRFCGASAPLSGSLYGIVGLFATIGALVAMIVFCSDWIMEGTK